MKKNKKLIIMMASIIMIAAVAVAGTLAWLYTNTDTVTNTFVPAQVGNTVNTDNTVSNTITGVSNDELVDAYIRATYVVNWKVEIKENNVLVKTLLLPAESTDYTVGAGSSKWVKQRDGYYYYTEKVAPGDSTEALIGLVTANVETPTSELYPDAVFGLNVEIVSQSIQADGVTSAGVPAVEDAWEVVTVAADGTLIAK